MIDHDIEAGALERGEIMRWRRTERLRLIAERLKLSAEKRRRHAEAIERHLTDALGDLHGRTIGVYWPFRGESNLRSWTKQIDASGGHCALPVVVMRRAPPVFRTWRPGAAMGSGLWNIPVPADNNVVPLVHHGGFTPAAAGKPQPDGMPPFGQIFSD